MVSTSAKQRHIVIPLPFLDKQNKHKTDTALFPFLVRTSGVEDTFEAQRRATLALSQRGISHPSTASDTNQAGNGGRFGYGEANQLHLLEWSQMPHFSTPKVR